MYMKESKKLEKLGYINIFTDIYRYIYLRKRLQQTLKISLQ